MRTKKNGEPIIKGTVAQIDERLELVERLLSMGLRKGQIKLAVRQKFGTGARQCEVYLSRVRERIIKRMNGSLDGHRALSFAFYEEASAPGDGKKLVDRLRARERLDKLLGLDAPVVTELGGVLGKPIEIEHKVKGVIDYAGLETVARNIFGSAAHNGNGKPIHPAHADGQAGVFPQPDRT